MPLTVPNLDDRTYSDLVEEARSLIPRYAPEWTNHNPSDPGITLIELLAYFTEILLYRLNRVTRDHKLRFLRLLREVTPEEQERLANATMAAVDEALRRTVLALRQPQRAVTCNDYERLVRQVTANGPDEQQVIRARCFANTNLERTAATPQAGNSLGHISVVIVPKVELVPDRLGLFLEDIRNKLEPMRLLTTRLHVVGPQYLWVSLGAVIRTLPDVSFADVRTQAITVLAQFFSPLPGGGPTHEGWPFGRAIYLSEVYERLEQVEGVDSVQDVRILHLSGTGQALGETRTAIGIQIGVQSTLGVDSRLGGETETERLMRDTSGKLIAVTLRPHELLRVIVREDDVFPAIAHGGS